jgi:hypothetical protein
MKEATTAVMTGIIRFRTARLEAGDLEIPHVMLNFARTCPPPPANVNLPQSDHGSQRDPVWTRRLRISSGTNKSVVMGPGDYTARWAAINAMYFENTREGQARELLLSRTLSPSVESRVRQFKAILVIGALVLRTFTAAASNCRCVGAADRK